MPNLTPPATIYPVAESFWAIGKEAVSGTPATAFTTMASAAFTPDDKVTWLKNETLHGSMGTLFGLQQGPLWAEHQVPESPLYGDTIGHVLLNFFGDYYTSGTATTPVWTTSAPLTPGAGPIPVTTASAAVAGTTVQIDTTGVNSEVVKVGTGSTTTSIVVDPSTPIRFSHLTAIAVTTVTGPYTHKFSQLNLNSSTGVTSGQPPSHTLLHRTGIPGSGNFYATQYAYSCWSELTIMGKASGYVTWAGKATSWSRSYPAATVTPAFSGVAPWPAWQSTNTVGGSLVNDITEWTCTLTRKERPIPAANGQQAPYVIARGPVDTKFDLTYDPAIDESALNHVLNNDQPTLAWSVSNGLTGLNLVSMGINAQLGGYQDAPLQAQQELWGYKASGEFIQSTAMAGNSGGYGPCQITLTNQTATY